MALRCACGCGASLAGMRSDARWASDACRKRAKRTPSPDKARTGGRSHPENGTRVYLLPEDFDGLLYDTNYLLDSTLAKIERAAWRVGLASDGRTPLAGATEREQRRAREGLSGRASPPAS